MGDHPRQIIKSSFLAFRTPRKPGYSMDRSMPELVSAHTSVTEAESFCQVGFKVFFFESGSY
jgi:hypothetical protein